MNQSAEILVIINSVVLVLFLLVAIIALVQIVLLLRHLRHLIEKAEDAADAIESIGKTFQTAAIPYGIGRFITGVIQPFMKETKRGKK